MIFQQAQRVAIDALRDPQMPSAPLSFGCFARLRIPLYLSLPAGRHGFDHASRSAALPDTASATGKPDAGTLYIEPGSPWGNGYCESFNGKLRDECLSGEIFYLLREAQIMIEKWRVVYNTLRPHLAPGYRPPAPAAFAPQLAALRSPTAPCEPPVASLPDEAVM